MSKIEKLNAEQPDPMPNDYGGVIMLSNTDISDSSPTHYSRLTPQTIQRLQDVLSPEEFQGFCRGNVIKYAERMRYKDEPSKEAKKIIDYAKWLYQSLKGEKITID